MIERWARPGQWEDRFLKLLYRAGARDAVALFFPELAARIDWEPIEWIDKAVLIRGVKRAR